MMLACLIKTAKRKKGLQRVELGILPEESVSKLG